LHHKDQVIQTAADPKLSRSQSAADERDPSTPAAFAAAQHRPQSTRNLYITKDENGRKAFGTLRGKNIPC
jgi:hypothetical protein